MAWASVGLGSNRQRRTHLNAALAALAREFGPVTASTAWRTRPVGVEGPDFFNLVAGFEASTEVHELVRRLKALEEAVAGPSPGPGQPRALDIDLLLFDDLIIDEPDLRLPRRDVLTFPFVLAGLAEIAGQRRHPVLGMSFAELWADTDEPPGLEAVDLAAEDEG